MFSHTCSNESGHYGSFLGIKGFRHLYTFILPWMLRDCEIQLHRLVVGDSPWVLILFQKLVESRLHPTCFLGFFLNPFV